jgi:putative PIN family toxin of toxin-antitoxin system
VIRAIIDSGILVRAIIKPEGSVIQHFRDRNYTLLYSEPLLDELTDVLNRPRIRSKYGLAPDDITQVLASILLLGEAVVPQRRVAICRDPDDDRVLEAAIAGKADVIVSGDRDILILGAFEGIPIVQPRAFRDMVESSGPA